MKLAHLIKTLEFTNYLFDSAEIHFITLPNFYYLSLICWREYHVASKFKAYAKKRLISI